MAPWQCSSAHNAEASSEREFGYAQVEVQTDSALIHGIEDSLSADAAAADVWMSHGDIKVTAIPSDRDQAASTETRPFAIMANEEKPLLRRSSTRKNPQLARSAACWTRFVRDICQCEGCGLAMII